MNLDNIKLKNYEEYIRIIEALKKEVEYEKKEKMYYKVIYYKLKNIINSIGEKFYKKNILQRSINSCLSSSDDSFEASSKSGDCSAATAKSGDLKEDASFGGDCRSAASEGGDSFTFGSEGETLSEGSLRINKKFKNYKRSDNFEIEKTKEEVAERIEDTNIIHFSSEKVTNKEKINKICMNNMDVLKKTPINSNTIKHFELLKFKRESGSEYMNVDDYVELLKYVSFHIQYIISTNKNRLIEDEIINILECSLSELDLILLDYPTNITNICIIDRYININDKNIDIAINLFSNSLIYTQKYKKYKIDDIIETKYLKLPIPIDVIISKSLLNIYGFNTICYLESFYINPAKKSNTKDEYTFYKLKEIIDDVRYWELDCRLEKFIDQLYTSINYFYMTYFKTLYLLFYGNNIYRKEPFECNTYFKLYIENIYYISSEKFKNYILSFVKENMRIIPTEKDKFNLFSDSFVVSYSDQESDTAPESSHCFVPKFKNSMEQLFDDISTDEILEVIKYLDI